ncbi:unnamed protein product [Rhizophagus irregularis]|nr:unnamed protein product [Rhizophagus irregularis]
MMPSNAWYTALVAQDPNNRHAIQRSNEEERSLIPLLPGYVAFTTAGKNRFKLSILENNNQLLFLWEEFGSDVSYSNRKAHGVERLAFRLMLKKYGLELNNTVRLILGLYDPQIINKLQRLVYEKFPLRYPTIFQEESRVILSENLKSNAKKKEETLHRSLKRGQEEIDNFLCEKDNDNQDIRFGIRVEPNGKSLSPKQTQVLMLKSLEYKQTIYSQNKTIKKLKEKITTINDKAEDTIETDDIITLNDAEIKKSVEKEIEEKKLGIGNNWNN